MLLSIRVSKCALLSGVTLFFMLVVLNNIQDYGSNYLFVQHVLSMDSTFTGNHVLWRAIKQPRLHQAFYLAIILWEGWTCLLCLAGTVRLGMNLAQADAASFRQAKSWAILGLTCACLLWMVAFLDVGGEWFLMWQSKVWNGQDAAFRMFTIDAIVLVFLSLPEPA